MIDHTVRPRPLPRAGPVALGADAGPPRRSWRETPEWRVGVVVFACASVLALAVQLVILPHVVPGWHAGAGLLRDHDWVRFHHMAVVMAERIRTEGWAAWELRPEGQAPAGIAAAVYAVVAPRPLALIPLHAALHALAAVVLLRIVRTFVTDARLAVWAVVPFAAYPSAMGWYTQIHKDGFAIAGALLVVHGWIGLARSETWRGRWWRPVVALAEVWSGACLAWLVRPYLAEVMTGTGALVAVLISATLFGRLARRRLDVVRAVGGVTLAWVAVVGIGALPAGQDIEERVSRATRATRSAFSWNRTPWMPSVVDRAARAVAVTRHGYQESYPDARSNIDTDVRLGSATELLAYLPRAAAIGLLAPFPDQWLGEGSGPATTWMRRVAAGEMLGVYLALAFLPYGVWRWRARLELWVLLLFSGGALVVHALVITNVGALHRLRYGYLLTIVALGIAALGTLAGERGPRAHGERRG